MAADATAGGNDARIGKVIGIIGDSGMGKTTLIERLIARFAGAGLRVAAIKHAHHGFDVDHPGKDSYRYRVAGAGQVLVASARRWVLMTERSAAQPDADLDLAAQLARLEPCDLVLVEGFRGQAAVAYIEVRRHRGVTAAPARPPRPPAPGRIAIATDDPRADGGDPGLPRLALDDVEAIAGFIARTLELPTC